MGTHSKCPEKYRAVNWSGMLSAMKESSKVFHKFKKKKDRFVNIQKTSILSSMAIILKPVEKNSLTRKTHISHICTNSTNQ